MRFLVAGVAALALAACVQEKPAPLGPPIVVPAGPGLTPAAIREAVVGNIGTGVMSGSQITYSIYVAPDGTTETRLPTGVDPGAWRLTDDGQFCAKGRLFRNGEEYCQRVYKDGDIYKFVNNNSVELLTFAPGKRF
jgi:hypothetical protein